ncbi:MAG: flagellar biosynthesis anti-sigma factor FlgM [Candidatus Lambdaproteobacteria bacterium]|nr:flagellar biosynthesis anti-sigma factor FlgM [Candidatus Lambdaproteobacteria bacterium]
MKVTGQQPPKTAELTAGKVREQEAKQPAAQPQTVREQDSAANRTSLTTTRLREAIRTAPDVREERVAELRERIRAGKYETDAERLAKNLINASLREDIERP